MSLDGAGLYQPPTPEFPAIPNTAILANDFNQIILDIATALSAAIFRDGQAAFTANQSHGGFKIINLANGTAPQDAVTVLQAFTDPTFIGTTADGTQVTGTALKVVVQNALISAAVLLDMSASGEVRLPAVTSIGSVTAEEIARLDGVTSSIQEQFDAITGEDLPGKANLEGGNVFTGLQQMLAALADGSTAATRPATDSSTNVATTAFVQAVAMNSALPAQGPSTAGMVPVSDGNTAHWSGIAGNSLYLATNLGAL